MKYHSITVAMEKISGIESEYSEMIYNYSTLEGMKVTGSPIFFIPPEINAAFNILSLKIPAFILDKPDSVQKISSLYDAVITSEHRCCCNESINSYSTPYIFRTPTGYGEDASVSLHNEISLMLRKIFDIELKSINIEKLQRKTLIHEKLRRLVRSVSLLRSENIKLLSNAELSLIFETALILPPEIAIDYINPVFEEMKKIEGTDKNKDTYIRGMIYGGKDIPSAIADTIEAGGIIIIEDDSCTGRRSFDISLNADSEYIFYEILDAYSYRPLTSCLRPVHERYELLYRLLKNYNIETVIFFRNDNCDYSKDSIDYLRIKMMRDGIDPLVIDNNNYSEVIADYLKRI